MNVKSDQLRKAADYFNQLADLIDKRQARYQEGGISIAVDSHLFSFGDDGMARLGNMSDYNTITVSCDLQLLVHKDSTL